MKPTNKFKKNTTKKSTRQFYIYLNVNIHMNEKRLSI